MADKTYSYVDHYCRLVKAESDKIAMRTCSMHGWIWSSLRNTLIAVYRGKDCLRALRDTNKIQVSVGEGDAQSITYQVRNNRNDPNDKHDGKEGTISVPNCKHPQSRKHCMMGVMVSSSNEPQITSLAYVRLGSR